ncbi:MHS family MFS transporter [Rhodococcus erythropolis]|uniref:MFS transporter n=1 Tax=Rhodococcus erythropolis TaxID=1833 RepID=UPI0008A6164F|nr:MFS transporter [Rhodococcus erythropolis]MBT1258341.1 MHS family MFS transporter [Rhodococcus erythropolis]OHF24930.1 MFS transporter [Rhodococcus erythropolis]
MSHTKLEDPTEHAPLSEDAIRRRVGAATIIGSALEWYDFYLYAAMAALVFGDIFFAQSASASGTMAAFATFAVGFIARPFGGILFGHLGDRIGRKKVMVITFALMGVSTGLIGLLPDYSQIGMLAPIMLVIFRVFQGLGSGAEYSSAAVVAYEHATAERRGRQGAWPALGLNIGLLASSLTVAALTTLPEDVLLGWAWRIPFIASFALVGVGMWVRGRVPETEEFEELAKKRASETTATKTQIPFIQLIRTDWRGLLVVMSLALGYNALSYIFKTFSLAYLTKFRDVAANVGAIGITIASAVAIVTVPLFGRASDKYGSRKVILAGSLASALFAFPFFAFMHAGTVGIILGLVIATGILAPAMFAPQGAFLSKQFAASVRVSGVGTGREFGGAISGGLAPLAALAIVGASATHATWGVSLILLVGAVLVGLAGLLDQGKRHSHDRN